MDLLLPVNSASHGAMITGIPRGSGPERPRLLMQLTSLTLCLPTGQIPGGIRLGCQQGARLQAAAAGPPAHLPHHSSLFYFILFLFSPQIFCNSSAGTGSLESVRMEGLSSCTAHSSKALPEASHRQSSVPGIIWLLHITHGTVREPCRERSRHLEQQLPMPPEEASHGQEDLLGSASQRMARSRLRRGASPAADGGEGRHRRAQPRFLLSFLPSG